MTADADPGPALFTIGIDTGGTYTDAALMDPRRHRLLAKAKALTTRGDLSIGVTEALARVLADAGRHGDAVAPRSISLVALSTTLATNAIVEGHGAPVAVVLIGFGDGMAARTGIAEALPGTPVHRLAGGHDHGGAEVEALDLEALAAILEQTGNRVEAFAVAARYSVRNADHERRARDLIHQVTGLPVTLSSELAEDLDAPRRALTAALNARIISPITALIDAVRRGMKAHAIAAPLMIVKGDGSLATAESVSERPIETILSGPAASVIGAKYLSGLDDFVIADIGGTTTDVATLRAGRPRLNREGSTVGGWRTMVRAIDMQTLGLGGDSEVAMDGPGAVYLKSNRVVPVALIGARWPQVIDCMTRMLADPQGTRYGGRFALRPLGSQPQRLPSDLAPDLAALLRRIGPDPRPLHELLSGLADQRALARLQARGLVQIAAFTPSDAAHILDLQSQWSRPAAMLAALLLKRSRRMIRPQEGEREARDFARETFEAVVVASGRVLVETLAGHRFGADDPVLASVLAGAPALNSLRVSMQPDVPIVAVGGPAPVFYPELGRRLGAELVLHADADVANAIGAAVALVRVRATVEITSGGAGVYRIHHDGDPERVTAPTAALERARDLASQAASRRARLTGGAPGEMTISVERVDVPESTGDSGLIAATVVAECWGLPDL